MADRSFYDGMSRDQLIARLKVAEDALVLIGWTSTNLGQLPEFDTERTKAAEQQWVLWCEMVGGSDFCDAERHPDLERRTPELAAMRDRIRADTLRRFGLDGDGR